MCKSDVCPEGNNCADCENSGQYACTPCTMAAVNKILADPKHQAILEQLKDR